VIDAPKVAHDKRHGGRINTIMQVCFFALSGVLPRDRHRPSSIPQEDLRQKRRGSRGHESQAVDNTLEHLHEVPVPKN